MRSHSWWRSPTRRANDRSGVDAAVASVIVTSHGSGSPVITSTRNPLVLDTVSLHRSRERRQQGLTIIEGPHVFAAAVRFGVKPTIVFSLEDDEVTGEICATNALTLRPVAADVLRRLAPTRTPRGPVAVIPVPDARNVRPSDTTVLLGVSDPGNAGTLVRSASGFGFDIAAGDGSADLWSPKVLRAGAGAQFDVRVAAVGSDPVAELREAGLFVVASVPAIGAAISELPPGPMALLVGSEASGLPHGVVEACDAKTSIPTVLVESLNAAVAGSILMYERARAREPRRP